MILTNLKQMEEKGIATKYRHNNKLFIKYFFHDLKLTKNTKRAADFLKITKSFNRPFLRAIFHV